MKAKTIWLTLLLFLTIAVFPLYVEGAQKIKQLGVTPVCKIKNLQADKVYAAVKKNERDLRTGFQKAGVADVFDPFMDQLKTSKPETVQVQPGTSSNGCSLRKRNWSVLPKTWSGPGKNPLRPSEPLSGIRTKTTNLLFRRFV